MASRYGKAKQAVSNGLRKLFLAAVAAGTVGGTGYYHIGTIEEVEAKVKNQRSEGIYGSNGFEGYYLLTTDKGDFVIKKSTLHLVSDQDVARMYSTTYNEHTYKFKVWGGIPALGVEPKVQSVREVSEQELKDREIEKQKAIEAGKAKKAAAVNPANQPAVQPGTVAPQAGAVGVLSGRVQTVDIVYNNEVIQLTVPVEAAGRIIVNNVTPLQVSPPPPKPPGF